MDKKQELKNLIEVTVKSEVKHLAIDEENSLVTIILSVVKGTDEKSLSRQIAKIVKIDMGFKGLKLSIEQQLLEVKPNLKTKYITVTSGKGGVGKSTVSGNLAVALSRLGKNVGIIDADVYGPSLPQLFGITEPKMQMNADNKIIPMKTEDGVAIMSTEFLTEDASPLMWRGPMLSRMLEHFFEDVLWGEEYDYIIIDLPPGTGDIPLDLKNFIPEAKAIVVTTPNKMAAHIAVKSGVMAKNLGHDLLGVVENMSYFINPANGERENIFGLGGGKSVADDLETEVLAEIPISQTKEGFSSGIFSVHEENGIEYLGLANKILKSTQK